MTEEQYIKALKNNPHGIRNIPNPTEGMQLACVEQNGMLLQYIKNPTNLVIETALAESPRAIQYVENPSDELLISLVKQDWAVLEYIQNPSDEVVYIALEQSGWAVRYIQNPSEALQLTAVRKQYDALQYIVNPSEQVQMAAVESNYLALRYIPNPTMAILKMAVLQNPQAMRQITHLDLETVVELLKVSTLILGYVHKKIGLTVDMVRQILIEMIANPDVEERYVRELVSNPAIGGRQSTWPIDILSLVDMYGSVKAKKIAVDQYLLY